MDGGLVLQGYDSKHPPMELVYTPPETKSVEFLWFAVQRIFNDPNAPFPFDVRALPHNLIFKVFSKLIFFHDHYTFFIRFPAMFSGRSESGRFVADAGTYFGRALGTGECTHPGPRYVLALAQFSLASPPSP